MSHTQCTLITELLVHPHAAYPSLHRTHTGDNQQMRTQLQ